MHTRIALPAVFVLFACGAPPAPAPVVDPGVEPRAAFGFEVASLDSLTPTWGTVFAPDGAGGGVRVGGVAGAMGPVVDELGALRVSGDALRFERLDVPGPPRFCGCAMLDPGRDELLVIGGRDGRFAEQAEAILVDLDDGAQVVLDDGGAAANPVGCTAMFFPALDRGYVFGGGGRTGFSAQTWRYEPEGRRFVLLEVEGPSARYDASVKIVDDDVAILAGGMGGGLRLTFHSDLWRFDASAESWTPIEVQAGGPAGRRVPWIALGPDDDTLLFGFGADRPDGSSTLADLWRISLTEGIWSEVEVELGEGVDEDLMPRGFTPHLPGPPGSVGFLAAGYNGVELISDTWVLAPPDDLAGVWR